VVLSVSAVLLLGAVIVLLMRYRIIRKLELFLCGTFGFLLAGTGLGPLIRTGLDELGAILSNLHA